MQGSHTYAATGSYTLTLAVTDSVGNSANATASAVVAAAQLSVQAVAITPVANQPFSGTVATFSLGGAALASEFSASINWGDGTITPGTVSANANGGFDVQGSHTYTDQNAHTPAITVAERRGDSASGTATVQPAALGVTGNTSSSSKTRRSPTRSPPSRTPTPRQLPTASRPSSTGETALPLLAPSSPIPAAASTCKPATATPPPALTSRKSSSSMRRKMFKSLPRPWTCAPTTSICRRNLDGAGRSTLQRRRRHDHRPRRYRHSPLRSPGASMAPPRAAVIASNADGSFSVQGSYAFASAGTYTITVAATDASGTVTAASTHDRAAPP